ncbi:DUF1801 domain-containing protein [Phenylobacterium sp.]|jgi:hypothetical protein|uniref:DUF1801 domain-containing protein n=1 Tax=Phenylobacterium sp. TaxID=1871053 RepID=UPI0012165E16|nr:DUF1801 domain-containing protein [Phenylobacterium sp.]THD65628.1 MAG: DUF1801 domain-containing protein [Phenylobacterium sp.]
MDPEAQIESFIAKYSDPIAAEIRAARADMQRRLPGAVELVYDNYNALAIGYGASEKLEDVVFSIACFPRWVRLFFFHGADLNDPDGLLEGQGAQVRSLKLPDLTVLDDPKVLALMAQALANARPIDATRPSRSIVKSVSPNQRRRRP